MEQFYLEDGRLFGVTVLHCSPATVLQIKTKDKDGYTSLQLGFGQAKKANQALKGHLKKSKSTPPGKIKEIKLSSDDSNIKLGDQITVDQVLENRDLIKVTGITKGRGFAGVIKRHGFHCQPATHGQSDRERTTGSIGAQTPGKVIKGKKMPGHMGNTSVSIKNLKILKVDQKNERIYIIGSVPGPINSWVEIQKTGKKAQESFKLPSDPEPKKIKKTKKEVKK